MSIKNSILFFVANNESLFSGSGRREAALFPGQLAGGRGDDNGARRLHETDMG